MNMVEVLISAEFSTSAIIPSILYIRTRIKNHICSSCNENDLIFYTGVYRTEVIMDNYNLVVAENLKSIRVSKGWSQKFVADQLDLAQRTISRAECGVGISKRTMKLLCNFYQVPVSSLYNESTQEQPRSIQVVPDEVAVGLLIRNSFIQDLEQEVVLRYTDVIQKEALMMREDIEEILPEVISKKKTYTFADIVSCCMAINQQTICKIRSMVIA